MKSSGIIPVIWEEIWGQAGWIKMGKDNFGTYHPIINFVYFVFVIGCSMFLRHPVFLGDFLCEWFLFTIFILKERKHSKQLYGS